MPFTTITNVSPNNCLSVSLLEDTTNLNILTSLKLPPAGISKYKPFFGRFDQDIYAEVYSRLLETVILLLKKNYDQKASFEDFLKETKGTSVILTIDVATDFHNIVENLDKIIEGKWPP